MNELVAAVDATIPEGAVDGREFARLIGKPFTTVYLWLRKGYVASTPVKRGERQEVYWVAPDEIERAKADLAVRGTLVPSRQLAAV
jgi:hypothetical protein